MKNMSSFWGLVVALLVFLFSAPVLGASVAGADTPVTAKTDIRHKAINRVRAGERIEVEARVRDPEGVDVVRTYFKARDAANFSFVSMEPARRDRFTGVLPAPANDAGWVDYLILVKNGADQVVKSQTFRMEVQESDQMVAYDTPVQVQTELAQAPEVVTGFQDNIVTDLVESAFRYGYVAGITDALAAGGSTAGGGAVSAGTVAATGGGVGATAAVVGGLALAGGAVAAGGGDSGSSGGGSGGGGSGGGGSGGGGSVNELQGLWNGVGQWGGCPGLQVRARVDYTCSNGRIIGAAGWEEWFGLDCGVIRSSFNDSDFESDVPCNCSELRTFILGDGQLTSCSSSRITGSGTFDGFIETWILSR